MNDSPSFCQDLPAVAWSRLYEFRRRTQRKYPTIWNVPIRKRPHQVVMEMSGALDSLLELGAGKRNFFDRLKRHYPHLNYKSFDIDQSNYHDFYRLEDIEGKYDAVCMFEVIEHLRPELALKILTTAHQHLKPGGMIFVTTPNTFNPPQYLRDATHITPWCYDELGGILQLADFDLVKIYRLYHDAVLKKLMKRYLFLPLFRLIGVDFSKQVIAIGQKKA